jgi:hypothetical protein
MSEEKQKKAPRRKPMWLMVPVGERAVEHGGVTEMQPLYTVEAFTSIVDLRKNLEARELDPSNAKGIFLFRADAIPVEAKMKAQIVIKFGGADESGEES